MVIGVLSLIAAIVLSLISAYFSVTGLVTIFSGAVVATMLMGSALEFSKIAATVWLHSWWKKASRLLKYYLVFAVVVLIAISSLGIFAFLSYAYVGSTAPAIQLQTRIERIDQDIARYERDIQRAEQALEVLDESIAIYFEYDQATRGLEQREEQAEQRNELRSEIDAAQDEIANLQDARYELMNEVNTLETNVGPIKYLAALIFGEDNAESNYDNAARIFILLLVIVFDPFAVLMMVSGNIAIEKANAKKTRKNKQQTKKSRKPKSTTEGKQLPMVEDKPEKKKKVVEVDMSEYVDPSEIKEIKKQTNHRRKP